VGVADPGRADGQPAFDARLGLLTLVMRLVEAGPVLLLLLLVICLSILEPVFLTTRNIGNVLAQTSVISVLAMGQLLVIVTRGVDLSVGATVALSSVVGALAFGYVDGGLAIVAVMLATGLMVGLVNGVVYVWGRMPHPFIVTLASLSVARGLALWLADGRSTMPGGMPDLITFLGSATIGFVPVSFPSWCCWRSRSRSSPRAWCGGDGSSPWAAIPRPPAARRCRSRGSTRRCTP
jgi:ribose transport system permease protein